MQTWVTSEFLEKGIDVRTINARVESWKFGVILLALLLAGCAVGPIIGRPKCLHRQLAQRDERRLGTPSQQKLRNSPGGGTVSTTPQLSRLIEEAAHNLDLNQAQARLREARARRGVPQPIASDLCVTGAAQSQSHQQGMGMGVVASTTLVRPLTQLEPDIFWRKRRLGGDLQQP